MFRIQMFRIQMFGLKAQKHIAQGRAKRRPGFLM